LIVLRSCICTETSAIAVVVLRAFLSRKIEKGKVKQGGCAMDDFVARQRSGTH
jgi:hypothetical protein